MIGWIYFITGLFIAIFVHELGHLIAALLCGVNVEAFSIGFGRPIISKKIKGIDFRIGWIPLGGYTKLSGEFDKRPKGFLIQPYYKKAIISLAGVFMNFLVACLCYWLNYRSILFGIYFDFVTFKWLCLKYYEPLSYLILKYNPNLFLLQLSLINSVCGIFNMLPIPALDGALLWLFWLEKKVKDFPRFLKKICTIGFIFLIIIQVILLYLIYGT